MMERVTKLIVTLGPSTSSERSHSELKDLEHSLRLAKRVGIPFIIDTEGSQTRVGELEQAVLSFQQNAEVRVTARPILGNMAEIPLRPPSALPQLKEGDLIYIDFDTLILRVSDISAISDGYVTTHALMSGFVGRNKAVVIDPVLERRFELPTLSEKDYRSIELGLAEGIDHIAVSFVRSGASVAEVRRATKGKMKIISKVECVDALENIDDIIEESDFLLIDRGDLSKEVPIERIPFLQKIIIRKAQKRGTGVFVATNLLETMIDKQQPTRAEVQDVINTIVDGAAGLTLAAETAIGRHPMECVNMLNRLIQHAESVIHEGDLSKTHPLVEVLAESDYLVSSGATSSVLAPPHGGKLIHRALRSRPEQAYLDSLRKVPLDHNRQMEVEQIAIGTYSPLEGFMTEADLHSVLTAMRLQSGVVWPLPIVLDVPVHLAQNLEVGEPIGLTNECGEVIALLDLEEKYHFDKALACKEIYGTTSLEHPGVRMTWEMHPVLLAGKVNLVERRQSDTREYELTPKQVRRLFAERGWHTVLGFHTRNVIHRGHEFIQLLAMERANCDGLFVQPIIGGKKPGDFTPRYIVKSYQKMMESFYPQDKVVLSVLATFSRYAGPREALFTALCRKNFGCTHFVVGRDHTGVDGFYDPNASHQIFDAFPELGISPVKFDEVFYSPRLKSYCVQAPNSDADNGDKLRISGSQARQMLVSGKSPPPWMMRPEISEIILDAIGKGEEVFVRPR
jgi:ATP sulfurylase